MTGLVVHDCFTFEELKDRNVRGIGKLPLNKVKMESVKNIVCAWYPFRVEENSHSAWRMCEKNVDCYLRKAPYTKCIKETSTCSVQSN